MKQHTPQQPDLFAPDAEQIKQYHLQKLKTLRAEFVNKLKARGEWQWKK